jgi:hypothetical protein
MASFPAPTGLAFEAIEVKYDNSPGHQFNHLFDFDTDLEVAAQTFLKKIRKGLNQRHLKKKVPNGKLVPEIYSVVELTGMKIFLTPILTEFL